MRKQGWVILLLLWGLAAGIVSAEYGWVQPKPIDTKVQGFIWDSGTKKAISGVEIIVRGYPRNNATTDSKGYFNAGTLSQYQSTK